jgi:hypothetical protein
MSKEKQPIQEGLFGAAKKFTDAFFDGLKVNATNRALSQAQNNPKIPGTIVDKMRELDKASKELQKMIKELE